MPRNGNECGKNLSFPEELQKEMPFAMQRFRLSSGHCINYLDTGGDLPAAVMLHAFPMWSFSFRKVALHLRKDFRIIAPDHLGFGLSDKPEDYEYSAENHAGNLEELLEHLGLKEVSLVLNGWSIMIGLLYLFRNPTSVRDLIVMNSVAFSGYSPPPALRIFHFLPGVEAWLYYLMNFASPAFLRLPKPVRKGYLFPSRLPGGFQAFRDFSKCFPWYPESASFSGIVAMEHRLWLLHRYHMALIWSKKDWMYPEKYLEVWQRFCPHAKVYHVESKGRFMLENASEEIAGAIRAFFRSGAKQ